MDIIKPGSRMYVDEKNTPESTKRPARIDSVCCIKCKRHVPLYMMTDEYGNTYEDPVLLDASFICKQCWKRCMKQREQREIR